MKKAIILILTMVIVVSCHQENDIKITDFNWLSKFYKDTTFNEMYIYPDMLFNDSLYFFKGNKIDSNTFNLLTKNATSSLPYSEGFYGVYSFIINEQYVGLITRTPAEYSSTMISLWIYDLKTDSITNNIPLANTFGDAGAAEIINSYLFFDKDKQLHSFTYRFYSYDHSVEIENDSTIEEEYDYLLTRIKYLNIDTLSKDSVKLNNQFKKQILRMTKSPFYLTN